MCIEELHGHFSIESITNIFYISCNTIWKQFQRRCTKEHRTTEQNIFWKKWPLVQQHSCPQFSRNALDTKFASNFVVLRYFTQSSHFNSRQMLPLVVVLLTTDRHRHCLHFSKNKSRFKRLSTASGWRQETRKGWRLKQDYFGDSLYLIQVKNVLHKQ